MSGEPMEPEFAVIADVYHIGEVHDSEDEAETEDVQKETIAPEEEGGSGTEEAEADSESEKEAEAEEWLRNKRAAEETEQP